MLLFVSFCGLSSFLQHYEPEEVCRWCTVELLFTPPPAVLLTSSLGPLSLLQHHEAKHVYEQCTIELHDIVLYCLSFISSDRLCFLWQVERRHSLTSIGKPYLASTHPPQQATSRVPSHLAHHQVRFVAPHLDFNAIMESVPARPGMPGSLDPFASPILDMVFANFPVVKIGNVSCPFQSPHSILPISILMLFRSLMELPRQRSSTLSAVMPKPP